MPLLLCNFGLVTGDGCNPPVPGHIDIRAYQQSCSLDEGVSQPPPCCSACYNNGANCDGFNRDSPTSPNGSMGQGDVIYPAGWHCFKLGQNSTANSLPSSGDEDDEPCDETQECCHHPKSAELEAGRLVYRHGASPNSLGRPGKCAADPLYRVVGSALLADPVPVKSVGQCCDKCLEADGCGGWTVDMRRSGWHCSLFGIGPELRREKCARCYSGVRMELSTFI